MTAFQLGVLCATVVWVMCIVVYLRHERRCRKVLNEAIAELAEASAEVAKAAKAGEERRAQLISELAELERMVGRRA